MSYRVHSKKPSLPSIQYILGDTMKSSNDTSFQHSSSVNDYQETQYSTLPSELQQLSISAPIHKQSELPSSHRRPGSHARSFSDLTAFKTLSLSPLPPNNNRSRYPTHRRSISANISTHSVELLQQQQRQQQQQQKEIERSLTESPPITLNQLDEMPQQKLLCDALNIAETNYTKSVDNIVIKRDEDTGKYYCPFCQKSFNRPSSLKIHTYSHTGEKPFVCPVKGCGRQFSVQSNMRRHLRIHKKSKIKK